MNKSDFVTIIRNATNSTVDDAEKAFDTITLAITESLSNDETVTINNVGSLSTFTRKARNYTLPDGSVVSKESTTDVRFKDFKDLKLAINS